MSQSLIFAVFPIVVLLYSVVLHELAHGLAARSLGDTTAERAGRLTLNPIPHLDLFGSVILPILTMSIGGFMFGYAKPVPYDPSRLNDRLYGPAKVAVAGPAVNLMLAVLFGLSMRFLGPFLSPVLFDMIGLIVRINLVLAVFNLIPIPPLDGHWLLMTFLPVRYHALKVALYRYQWFLLAICIFFIFPALVPLLQAVFTLLTGQRLF
ncbi:MAG: site-2 protease family protein [Patescibacteria group bacterium]